MAVRVHVCILVCTAWLTGIAAPRTQAQDAPDAKPLPAASHSDDEIEPGVLATSVALVPGVLVHGGGAYVVGDRRTAKRLAIAGAAGVAAILGAGALIAGSGASRRLVGPFVPVVIAGGAVFLLGWAADLYAATTGGRDVTAVDRLPWLELDAGYRYIHDPQFDYGSFAHARADVRFSRLRLSPALWAALDDDNQRVTIDAAVRLRGRTPEQRSTDGSYLDVAGAATSHRYGSEGFTVYSTELRLDGRLDLAYVGRSLRGSFVEGQLGAGVELYDFNVPGSLWMDNLFGMLLARFGFGVYFGDGHTRTGEALVYYDHRHDDYAAGLGVRGLGGGVLGHFGATGHYYLTRHWGLSLFSEIGSAFIGGLGLRYRRFGEAT